MVNAPNTPLADAQTPAPRPKRMLTRFAVLSVLALASVILWVTNLFLMERFTEASRTRAELRLALYTGNIVTELQRNSVVPLLLAQDSELRGALASRDYSRSSQRLINLLDEVGAAGFLLLDGEGRAVAATDRNVLGTIYRDAPYFFQARRATDTVFSHHVNDKGAMEFAYARSVEVAGQPNGVIVVLVDLAKFERSWQGISDKVLVTDSLGTVVLATEPQWRGHPEAAALEEAPSERFVDQVAVLWAWLTRRAPDVYLGQEGKMRSDARVPFRGWRIVSFTPTQPVRDQVNGVLTLELLLLTTLLAVVLFRASDRARKRSALFQQDADELRLLNARLSDEIAERKRAEANLEIAEQTLEQSSKLAALGEMSAAVSHELNQPLAAMKTYLAGARLLVQRERPEEALSSFGRIDDLIERMGTITRQLKSYARRGGEAVGPMDLRLALSSALSMMEPQLKSRQVDVSRSVPLEPVMVNADQLRVEQVLINLFRNAVDATRDVDAPRIDIILAAGETATLSVRDNGHGIVDLETLFEPFYTTKAPGDGVGLGLAIASGFVAEFGGTLTARNGERGGAVFELRLPMEGGEALKPVTSVGSARAVAPVRQGALR